MGKFLAFTRVQEATADATGAKFLQTAGSSGKGMLAFFKKLQSQEFRYGYTDVDPFAQSHPLSGQRVATLTHTLQSRSEEHTSELQSLMRISYAVFCLKKKKKQYQDKLEENTQSSNKHKIHTTRIIYNK